ncbi:MAG: oligoendopeptidase F [Clostridiales bacterium]|nr:oligoendopeptidase F [Clostridiales bacterium]
MSDKNRQTQRHEIEDKYKWKISDLFPSDEAWEEEFEITKDLTNKLDNYRGKLSNSSSDLLGFLKLKDEVLFHYERVAVYAHRRHHEDMRVGKYQAFVNQVTSLGVGISSTLSFAEPEILEIPEDKLNEFIKSNDELKMYEFALEEIIRKKPHTLTAELEAILADAGEMANAPSDIFSMFNNADIKFPNVTDEEGNTIALTHGRYGLLMESKDRRVREEAFKGLYSVYDSFRNTLAATFTSNLKQEVFHAKVRNYPSTLAMRLDDANIPESVYMNLIESVNEHLPLMHKYVSLRKKLLGVDELHMYDIYTPIIKDVDMEIPYEKAKELVYEGLEPLGEEYRSILKEGFENQWIDVYENEGKRSGAYSSGAYGTHPFILLNYQDNLNNCFTLAHEMGHGIHTYYSSKTQPYTYADYKIFVAEVASTCNESLLMDYMLKETDDKLEKAYLLNYYLEQFKGTVFRQTMFAEFELITHQMAFEGKPLTADDLCKIYHDLNVKYFGDDIVIDKEIDMEWARIPHFYRAFYVYQYATGYSAAVALSRKILDEGKPAADNYINHFLKGGSSDYPINLLKKAGVDMTTKEPVDQALELFGKLIDQLEEIVG